ncbi:MAG: DNA-binding protein [Candidatus Thorarchaeota archaeon]|nr:DNA-binding protein [Candidatus Thorarchaeota archaeon]
MTDSSITKTGRTIVARLMPGEDILKSLERLVLEHNIRGGQLQLIGAVARAHLGYFDREKNQYVDFTVEEDLEVVSCMGNISRLAEGTPVVHAHMVVADRTGRTYGGHLLKGTEVSVTIEIVINEFQDEIRRALDKTSGLNLIKL